LSFTNLAFAIHLSVVDDQQGYGVIGTTEEGPEEIEHAPALSLTLARLPDVKTSITHVTLENLPDGGRCRDQGPATHTHTPTSSGHFLTMLQQAAADAIPGSFCDGKHYVGIE
jgi:hypothetical protein